MKIQSGALCLAPVLSLLVCAGSDLNNKTATANISVTIGTFGARLSGTANKWWGGVRGPDDKIYAIPYGSEEIILVEFF